jgi:hypothetical protein
MPRWRLVLLWLRLRAASEGCPAGRAHFAWGGGHLVAGIPFLRG